MKLFRFRELSYVYHAGTLLLWISLHFFSKTDHASFQENVLDVSAKRKAREN